MTDAWFEFDARHKPATCNAPAGRIVGTLHPDLDGGSYDLEFVIGQTTCATANTSSSSGANVAVDTGHQCAGGVQNVSVRINRTDSGGQRLQMAQPVCLA